jgi:hypothetical protein
MPKHTITYDAVKEASELYAAQRCLLVEDRLIQTFDYLSASASHSKRINVEVMIHELQNLWADDSLEDLADHLYYEAVEDTEL